MGDDAVIKIGYDDSKVRSGAKGTESVMAKSAHNVKTNWAHTSKELKDVFDPLSRGALVKAGAAGVAVYGVVSAVKTLRENVDRLSEADYLSTKQHAQMQTISDFMTEIDQERDRMMAGLIAGAGDLVTGGKVSAAAELDGHAQKREKLIKLEIELGRLQEARGRATMSDEEKLADIKERIAKLDEVIANKKKTPDEEKRNEKLIEREKLLTDQDKLERSIKQKTDQEQKALDEKNLARQTKAADLLANQRELSLRASGHNREADKVAREHKLDVRARDIADQLGIDPAAARGIAEQEQGLQDKIDRRSGKGNRRRIQGYDRDQWLKNSALDRRGFTEFFNNEGLRSGHLTANRIMDKSWQETFHTSDYRMPWAGKPAARNGSRDSMTTKQSGADPTTKLLEQIAAGISTLASYR